MTDLYDTNTRNRRDTSCKRHPNGGVVVVGGEERCYVCYCEQFDHCPLCGKLWEQHPPEDIDCRVKKSQEIKMERFWECYVEGTGGGNHHKHWTLQSAQTEGERLARLPNVQGKMVYLFECVGKCKIEQMPIIWEMPR